MRPRSRVARRLGTALAMAVGLSAPAAAQTGEELLAAHAEALGGAAALEAVETIRRTGRTRVETSFFDRLEGRAELAVVAGEKVYRHSDMGEFTTTSAWDGSRGWERGPEGFRELAGDELRLLKLAAEPFRTAGIGLDEGATVARVDDLETGGVAHPVVVIEETDGSRLTVVLHPDTHLAVRVVQTANLPGLGPAELVTNLFDYRRHGAILLPERVHTSIAGVFGAETVFETTEIDPELDPALFSPPP